MAKILTVADLPTRSTLWHSDSNALTGQSLGIAQGTSQAYATWANQSATPGNGDSWAQGFWARSGAYILTVLGLTNNVYGMVDWYVDNALALSGQDWYSAGMTYNVIKTGLLSLAFDGYHVLKGVVNGHNVLSGSPFYYIPLTKLWLKQASDTPPVPSTTHTFQISDYPTRALMWHDEATVLTGNAIALGVNTLQAYNTYAFQNPPANGNSFSHSAVMRAGTYTLSVMGVEAPDRGKIDWYVDDVLAVSAQDWYSAGAWNVVKTASITVASDGYHVLKGVINGKNAGSSNYYMILTRYWLRQAAD